MAHPTFRLTSLLSYREARLTEAMQHVARVESRLMAVQHDLDALEREREQARQSTVPIQSIRAGDLGLVTSYLDWLERRGAALQRERDQLRARLVEARATVVERLQATDVLRRLEARHVIAVRQEERQREQRDTDELASQRAAFMRFGPEAGR